MGLLCQNTPYNIYMKCILEVQRYIIFPKIPTSGSIISQQNAHICMIPCYLVMQTVTPILSTHTPQGGFSLSMRNRNAFIEGKSLNTLRPTL